ncbi:movement protein [Lilac leaf chlorosis virus]|uniref:Movement protein n=1 Tax=Lilac leaf chlorosis virus TaxID=722755 RepID=D6CHU2_9BROM|nr:movement protein [Lilac leaf chlorosis virus]CBJ94501.1 movement protein [Lilac leaf chlorosis virus]
MALSDNHTSDFTIVESSMQELQQVTEELHTLLLSKEMQNLPTKGRHVLHLQNLPKSNVLKLESKEQRSFLAKTNDKLKKRVYRDVGRMFFVYVPIIQKTSSGLLTLKLQNSDTGEVSDIATDIPANEAFVLMDRWGRSLVDNAELNLLYSVYCPDLRPQARVGEMVCFWDESMSRQQVYSERGNPIMFPIEETKPVQYLKDKKLLMSMVRARIAAGAEGESDLGPSPLSVERLGDKRKVLTIKPKESGSTSGLLVEEKKNFQKEKVPVRTENDFVQG